MQNKTTNFQIELQNFLISIFFIVDSTDNFEFFKDKKQNFHIFCQKMSIKTMRYWPNICITTRSLTSVTGFVCTWFVHLVSILKNRSSIGILIIKIAVAKCWSNFNKSNHHDCSHFWKCIFIKHRVWSNCSWNCGSTTLQLQNCKQFYSFLMTHQNQLLLTANCFLWI